MYTPFYPAFIYYVVKLRYTGVYPFFLFLPQNTDCGYSFEPPLTFTHNQCFKQKQEKYQNSSNKNSIFQFPDRCLLINVTFFILFKNETLTLSK